jgi:hypothetical protein
MGGENGLSGSSSIEKQGDFFSCSERRVFENGILSDSKQGTCFLLFEKTLLCMYQYKILRKKRSNGFLKHGFLYNKTL